MHFWDTKQHIVAYEDRVGLMVTYDYVNVPYVQWISNMNVIGT